MMCIIKRLNIPSVFFNGTDPPLFLPQSAE
jgi:hypothetical protein